MHLRAVGSHEIPELWPRIRERIASCCARSGGKYEPIDVLSNALSDRMQLWLAIGGSGDGRESPASALEINALAVTELAVYPRITVCRLLACTGDEAALWVDLLAGIEAWAKSRGCAAIEPVCRPGWERRLKPAGYRKTHVVLEKTL